MDMELIDYEDVKQDAATARIETVRSLQDMALRLTALVNELDGGSKAFADGGELGSEHALKHMVKGLGLLASMQVDMAHHVATVRRVQCSERMMAGVSVTLPSDVE